ncbi:hypothetical protein Ahy_B09g099573 [Arachis hypogaea]|uniref:Aminotransferase-like plant mobile domain-containing protein n=1 Tax=Arachis hypogaea TaxID=3818 RepID=A0A444XU94_ARAHY|nr:hypothetical protein Ahy_B09g099573 [Arachis hypogaea]
MPLHDRIIPYLEKTGLYHLAGLPVDGQPVSGYLIDFHLHIKGGRPAWEWFQKLFGELPPPEKVKQYMVHFTWFHEGFRMLPADASEETVRIYARVYIMMLLSTQLFGDKSGNRVHIRWLPFVARLDDMGSFSWGSVALAWLYRCMCRVANRNVTNLAGPYICYNHRSFGSSPRSGRRGLTSSLFCWHPVIHPEILTEENSRLTNSIAKWDTRSTQTVLMQPFSPIVITGDRMRMKELEYGIMKGQHQRNHESSSST